MDPTRPRVILTDEYGNERAMHNGMEAPRVPEQFLKDLAAFDKDLFPLWVPIRQRYSIQQCTEHHLGGRPLYNGHTDLCRAAYVVMVQDRNGDMLPMNDRVMDTLRKMRQVSQNFGGETERGRENFMRYTRNLQAEMEAKAEEEIRENYKNNWKDQFLTRSKLGSLLHHLFTAPNK